MASVWVIEDEATGEPIACGIGEPGEGMRATAGRRLISYTSEVAVRELGKMLQLLAEDCRTQAYAPTTSPHLVALYAGRADGLEMGAALLEILQR